MENSHQNQTEYYKAVFEYQRHLTTLSTGSIVLISTFLEKLFINPEWKPLIAVPLCSLLVSIIGSMLAYTFFVENMPGNLSDQNWPHGQRIMTGFGVFRPWAGFLLGVISLTAFSIKNLL